MRPADYDPSVMTAPTRRPFAVWLAGCLAGSVALLSGCDPSSQTPSENTTASTGDVRVSEVWRVENLPRTASVFLRSGRVVAAGEVEDGADDVLVVLDEAGMTDDADLLRLIDEATATGAKLVLVGDHGRQFLRGQARLL